MWSAGNETADVVLATDDPLVVGGVRRALRGSGLLVVAGAIEAEAAAELAIGLGPALLLLDVDVAGDALTACRAVRDETPSTKVVALCGSSDDEQLLAVLATGVAGCLVKSDDWSRLAPTLKGVLRGEPALPRTLVARLVAEVRNRRGRWIPLGPAARQLSDREWEILEQLAGGLTPNEIAGRLGVRPVTVRTHAASIVRKLGVADRTAAIALARRCLEPSPS